MGTLIGIAFVAGLVTAISPCVLPVLPIVFAGASTGSKWRPYAIVAGLIVSFTVFTFAATALLRALGLPSDLLRSIAIAVVIVMALSLIFPKIAAYLSKPFERFGRHRLGNSGSGFALGLSLGLLFTPCAGPIIAAVSLLAATQQFTVDAMLVTLAYALGAGLVLLAIAITAHRGLTAPSLHARAPQIRQALGMLMIGAAIVLILGLDARLAANVPSYTRALQSLEEGSAAADQIRNLTGSEKSVVDEQQLEEAEQAASAATEAEEAAAEDGDAETAAEDGGSTADPHDESVEQTLADRLPTYGQAPDFAAIEAWVNSGPLSIEELKGKVVVIDFWTYSCVNCIRTLPHLARWHETYADNGLVIVGVHTPEFAFERELANVEDAVEDFGIEYPVALDPDFATWRAWGNRFWPTKYFIDREGQVRFAHFGEGQYDETELVIRALLADGGESPDSMLVSAGIDDFTPSRPQTPETYVGWQRVEHYLGDPFAQNVEQTYTLANELTESAWSLGGDWTVEDERSVAGEDAVLTQNFLAEAAHLVLGPPAGGAGTVDVLINGELLMAVEVDSFRLYTLASELDYMEHDLELRFSPGVEAYAFTYGTIQDGAG